MVSPSAPRFVVGIGVGSYDDDALDLPQATNDVRKMVSWFSAHSTLPHQRALPDLSDNPTSTQIRSALGDWLNERESDDVVVIYIATHGAQIGSTSYVFGRDTPQERFAARAISAVDIGRMVGQCKVQRTLLLIDACGAGRLGRQILDAIEDTADEQNTRDPYGLCAHAVVCSTYGRDPAHDGKFAEAFLKVVTEERWTGTLQPWVSFDQLITGLREELRSVPGPQASETKVSQTSAAELIPNPNYGARPPTTLISADELSAHFDPAARGVPQGGAGQFFTGRTEELRRIVAWMRPESDAGHLLVITGTPGSGKSALLARAVLLSDPAYRATIEADKTIDPGTVPDANAFQCVVWCHNKTMRQIVREMSLRLLDRPLDDPKALAAALGSTAFTVAIDALDEAALDESAVIAERLIAPLASLPNARVLVATRHYPVRETHGPTDLHAAVGATPENRIDIDASHSHLADMHRYVISLLSAGGGVAAGVYRRQPELASALATRICKAAAASFLVAGITARTLAASDRAVDPSDEALALPSKVGEAMAAYIDRLARPERARDILRPLAWALGTGLPWGVLWARLANALADSRASADRHHYTDADVLEVLNSSGDLVVESAENGEPVYRLFHEALAETLRAERDPVAIHGLIADELLLDLEGDDWGTASQYVIAYLPRHLALASRGVALAALVTNPKWEQAKRMQMIDPGAWLADVNLAIDAINDAEPRGVGILPLCAIYSRMMGEAPPDVLEVLASEGQVRRAELMAGNIGHASARVHAFSAIAAVYMEQGDPVGAMRCLNEARRSTHPVGPAHAPMAWFHVCRAALACRLPNEARDAADQSLGNAVALARLSDEDGDAWDLGNALFWAAMAKRAVGDEGGLGIIRAELDRDVAAFRNQVLQAASVSKDVAFLKEMLAAFGGYATSGAHSPIRAGNLMLALADAGMTGEADELLDLVATYNLPLGEPDAQKRHAWGLAIVGRMEDALACVQSIPDMSEKLKALVRIAKLAEAKGSEIASKIADLIPGQSHTPSVAEEILIAKINMVLGRHAPALVIAEEVVQAYGSRAQSIAGQGTSPRWKAGRRPLEEDVAVVNDAARTETVAALVAEGNMDAALEVADAIKFDRARHEAFKRIAESHGSPSAAFDAWRQALLAARRVSRQAVESLLATGESLMERSGRGAEWADARQSLANLESAWDLALFCEHYEGLRSSVGSGQHRTYRMTSLLNVPMQLARSRAWSAAEIERIFHSGRTANRMFVLGLMRGDARLFDPAIVIDAICNSRSAFEQYHALAIAARAIHDLGEIDRRKVGDAVESAIAGGFISRRGHRWRLVQNIMQSVGRSVG